MRLQFAIAFVCAARAATITVSTAHPVRVFDPNHALGAGVDGHEKGQVDRMLSSANVKRMLSAGLKPLTYRLRTELGGEVWHWNPNGVWSDAKNRQGYWISDSKLVEPISLSYGYRLPRRGNTGDQANNDGYSRLDDGDRATFWKSNPYLDRRFTGEDSTAHPQWIVVDLGEPRPVNAIRLLWGVPYATAYVVEYAAGRLEPESFTAPGVWRRFAAGAFDSPATTVVRLCETPVRARFVRILMTASSHTAPPGSDDSRDALGFAMREIYVGSVDRAGVFHDFLRHGPARRSQSVIYVSSTDPWHRAIDKDDNTEQPGLDRVFRDGLTNGLPMLTPVGLLYDTPENAAAEIRYLKSRGYPVDRVEMGEEPDEQYVAAEDFAALYIQWADALHRVNTRLQLGGPSLIADSSTAGSTGSFLSRFLAFLRARDRVDDFTFFSFEWYPFDDVCARTAPQLARASSLLEGALAHFRRQGLPPALPWLITEYGYSAFGARAEVDIEGALFNVDMVGKFLTLGGDQAFLYGYEPNELIHQDSCPWGNNMLFLMNEEGRAGAPLATYYGARLVTQEWAQPSGGAHRIYPAASGAEKVAAYAVRRPDGQWAVLLINKDPRLAQSVRIRFDSAGFEGPVETYRFSGRQYRWRSNKDRGYPVRSEPPEHLTVAGGPNAEFPLPPYSLSVVRGYVASAPAR